MICLFPTSLLGRMIVVFTVAIIGVGLLASILTWQDSSRIVERTIREQMTGRIATLVAMLDTLTPEQRNHITEKLRKKTFAVEFNNTKLNIDAPLQIKNELVAAQYKQFLSNNFDDARPLAVTLVDNGGTDDASTLTPNTHNPLFSKKLLANHPYSLHFQVQLSDNSWVHFIWQAPIFAIDSLSTDLLTWLFIALAVIWLVAILVVRWITKPLYVLAKAAERLGEDISTPPLKEQGPREAQQAAHAFNKMQQRVQTLLAERTRFFAAISHDLKTPITRLRLRAELLNNSELQKKTIADLMEMDLLLSNALDYSRGVISQEVKQFIDIIALLQIISKEYSELGYPVQLPDNFSLKPLFASPNALKRCLTNIIDNAVRYGQEANISLTETATHITITVTDKGPGVPSIELEHLIEPFYRAEPSRNKNTGGHGLGLSIAQSIVEAHQGQLLLSCLEGSGLCVTVILPRRGEH